MSLSQFGGPPEIRAYNPEEARTKDSSLSIMVDLQNPGRTTLVRLVFIEYLESVESIDLMANAKGVSNLNSTRPDYKLVELKELTINSQYAVRRIESYRIDTDSGPNIYSLVATYFKTEHGVCSVLLVDALWSEMQSQMQVYEEIVNSFQASK